MWGGGRFDRKEFDPASLGDPVAMQTDWTPAESSSSTSFRSHALVKVNSDRLEFQPTVGHHVINLAPFVLGALFLSMAFLALRGVADNMALLAFAIPFGVFGLLALYLGIAMMRGDRHRRARFFDKQTGLYGTSRKSQDEKVAELDQIHALQLITERHPGSGESSGYTSHQLNLVCKNGKRINVVNYPSDDMFQHVVAILSEFLEKPVWDGTDEKVYGCFRGRRSRNVGW